MIFAWPHLKNVLFFLSIGTATAAPLTYSLGVFDSPRGGHSPQFFSGNSSSGFTQVSTSSDLDRDNWNDLKVNHAFLENMKKTVTLEEFKKLYGSLELREENLQGNRIKEVDGPKGAKDMTILDAWEKFFREGKENSTGKFFSYFGEDNQKLPFWNYDFPYIAVEFPKEFKLPDNLVQDSLEKGWVKVDANLLSKELNSSARKWKGLRETEQNFQRVISSQGYARENHINQNTLNKIMKSSEDSDLYLVFSPEKLLRMWLGDWNNSNNVTERSENGKYALFKNNHYLATEDYPEVSILTRWHNDKTYRMWIHHKPLSEYQVKSNQIIKKILAGKARFTVNKDEQRLDPKLKWSNNFLLNLMTWYVYTYKLSDKELSENRNYQTISKAGHWNLLNIYDLDKGANSRNAGYKDNFAKWIYDWYSGIDKGSEQYWKNVYNKFNLTDMVHFANRWKRISWVGHSMDELSNDWGQIKYNRRTNRR